MVKASPYYYLLVTLLRQTYNQSTYILGQLAIKRLLSTLPNQSKLVLGHLGRATCIVKLISAQDQPGRTGIYQ